MTVSELKSKHLEHHPESYFFSRETMKFFGDTMENFGVRPEPVDVITPLGDVVKCWVLYRKRPTRCPINNDYYFSTSDFKYIIPKS